MGRAIDKIRAKRANNSVITAEDSSFQVGNEEPQEAHVVYNTGKQEVKENNPTMKGEEATPTQEVKPINTDISQVDLSYKENPSIANNKNGDADIAEYYNDQVEDVSNQKDFFGVVQPVAPNQADILEEQVRKAGALNVDNSQNPNVPQGDIPDESNITFEEKKEEQPKTSETPQATEEEKEEKQYGDDWLYEFSKVNPKPNVLADLGFHGFEKHSVPDNLLNLWGKNLTGAIDDIKDENGNPLTDEQKKRILRRIRGVRAGQALMQIANIATQAAAVSQGGTPVKMDNSSILGKIHNQAQAKQDAWLKQALKAKETANKDKMDMLNYQLDWMKYQNDLQGKINDANIKKAQLALDAEKAEIDRQYKERLLNNAQYRAETARIKANKEAVENGDENVIKEINANAKLRDDFKIIKTKDGTVVIPYANLEQIYSELSKLEPNNQGDGETSNQSDAYSTSIGGNTKDVKTKLLGAVTSLINKHGYDKIKKYMVNDKATAERVLKAYGRGNKIYFNTGD